MNEIWIRVRCVCYLYAYVKPFFCINNLSKSRPFPLSTPKSHTISINGDATVFEKFLIQDSQYPHAIW
ncbi:hypothetical protein L1987_52210 [Smallanthus sonchifolius]|uniref:Uncharacterized protein n=1 Tax=Smallanthus sonchifolius TaxID=185202 RepID=A0ACB9ET33_9ASTR|nr:hypothetical protein L1987_52210 [Smallanthus sonchifolius]